MIVSAREDLWLEMNQRYLMAVLEEVRSALSSHASGAPVARDARAEAHPFPSTTGKAPPALERLCGTFQLSPFEREVLLLCAGCELDSAFAVLCGEAQGNAQKNYPTLSLALAALPGAHWSALTPAAPLRYWRMIEVGTGSALTTSPLRIDERILHYLTGLDTLDDRLTGLVERVTAEQDGELTKSQETVAERIAQGWRARGGSDAPMLIQLCGNARTEKRAIAEAACERLGVELFVLDARVLPTDARELEALLRLWEREARLQTSALLVDADELEASDSNHWSSMEKIADELTSPLMLSTRERRHPSQRMGLTLDVQKPTIEEQRALWASLVSHSPNLNGSVDALAAQFSLDAAQIRAAQLEASAQASENDFAKALWDASRAQARPALDDLAQRLAPTATWEDIVLPQTQLDVLRDIATHVRQRHKVYETWGWAAKNARGLGISALFAGASGTGKTMAAEVLANELRLDLYRIDLSSVVSKYIGETEKNLRRVFDAAEAGGAILLFDEADALFGKRSEVKDSHDRYANIEVSYLLQRMEAYRGLAILTTNLKEALDTAFLRRIRFIAHFPFPDAAQRAEIWRRIFPRATPTEGLDPLRLGQLVISGGNIRNIAMNASFIAADAGEPVQMTHLLRAARGEYAKLEKQLTESEIREWGK